MDSIPYSSIACCLCLVSFQFQEFDACSTSIHSQSFLVRHGKNCSFSKKLTLGKLGAFFVLGHSFRMSHDRDSLAALDALLRIGGSAQKQANPQFGRVAGNLTPLAAFSPNSMGPYPSLMPFPSGLYQQAPSSNAFSPAQINCLRTNTIQHGMPYPPSLTTESFTKGLVRKDLGPIEKSISSPKIMQKRKFETKLLDQGSASIEEHERLSEKSISETDAEIRSEKVEEALKSKPQRGRKRDDLNDMERLELTRTRNREHARSTR